MKTDPMRTDPTTTREIRSGLESLVGLCHGDAVARGWHANDARHDRNLLTGTRLMLIVSEIGEAMEADRKGLMDGKLPHRLGIEVELADAIIRIAGMAGDLDLDLSGAVIEKLEFNRTRADHSLEARAEANGMKY